MNIEIVAIGDELLLGFTTDTNSGDIARKLAPIGVRVVRRTTVGDDVQHIVEAVHAALERTGAVITTGGLGPTEDDMSPEAMAIAFGRKLELNESVLKNLEERWLKRFGHPMPESNRRQARLPVGATVLKNNFGSAPGILLEDEHHRWAITLPGVPREVRGMIGDTVVPWLAARRGDNPSVLVSRTIRTVGIAESALADQLGGLAKEVNGMPLASLPGRDGVDLRLTSQARTAADAERELDLAEKLIRARIDHYVYGTDDVELAALVVSACQSQGLKLAVAESCTGGMLGMRLTAVPGSSAAFLGGVISYANSVKERQLGVGSELLATYGAVSEEVALAMASGARNRLNADIGVGITGIAGPDGGTAEKPVGTVWVGVDLKGEATAVRALLPGNRSEIRWRATQLALDSVRRRLAGDQQLKGWASQSDNS